jgi:hypothetical protein
MTPEQLREKSYQHFKVPEPEATPEYSYGEITNTRRQIAHEISEIVSRHRSSQECELGGESRAFLFNITTINERATRIYVAAKAFPDDASTQNRFASLMFFAEMYADTAAEGAIKLETVDGPAINAVPFYEEQLPEVKFSDKSERLAHKAEQISAIEQTLHQMRDLYPDM